MTCVAIVENTIDNVQVITDKLKDREAEVKIISDLNDLSRHNIKVLVCNSKFECELGGSNNILSYARQSKVMKVLILEDKAKVFSLKKELGNALIRIAYNGLDKFCLELIISNILEKQNFIAGSKETFSLMNLAKRVAGTDVTVFINGPTGTGKEVVANYIHENSNRKDKPFVAINCAAIPENMLEAMLFGHEKGSFTGASQANKGIFRAADGGTLLLDEISEMPLSLQAKLLRVLQERKVTPVGGTREITIDVRVVGTTNRNMLLEVKENRFREDLYYRLNVFPIKTLNLKDRKDDIIPISIAILNKHLKKDKLMPFLTSSAQNALLNHKWSGNVRELENVLQRALVLSINDVIDASDIMIDDSLEDKSQSFSNNLQDRLALASATV